LKLDFEPSSRSGYRRKNKAQKVGKPSWASITIP
jgi:hypothetical protein